MGNLRVLTGGLWLIFSGVLIYGSRTWLLRFAGCEKPEIMKAEKIRSLVGLSLGNAIVITVICKLEDRVGIYAGENQFFQMAAEGILLSLLAGGLLAAACMDAESCYVYNYVWWWCLLWTGILLWHPVGGQNVGNRAWSTMNRIGIRQMEAVLLFVILQQCLFSRMYGRADSHAFSVCALISCHWEGEMLWFLLHMLLAVTLLTVVQLLKENVTCRGKLRIPKPFVPYIIITFWVEVLWMLCLQGG